MRELPVLVLDHQEPGKLLTQLRQPLPDEFEAGYDVADVIGTCELAPAVRELVERANSARRLYGELARCHRAS